MEGDVDMKNFFKVFVIVIIALLSVGCKEEYSLNYILHQTDNLSIYEVEGKKYVESAEPTNYVKIDVDKYGIIIAELYPEIAPITVNNFKSLISKNFYKNFIFHRVIKDFMIQTGDPNGDGTGGSSEEIKGEFSANGVINDISHVRGTLSMARQGNYPYPETEETMNSASSQFFIVHANSPHLDGQYAAFGSVVNGMDVVDIVATVSTDSADKPFVDQSLNSIRFVKEYEVSE
jgi:peptidyl-prolyl cis-trans isomerase B (cyclophilin B)